MIGFGVLVLFVFFYLFDFLVVCGLVVLVLLGVWLLLMLVYGEYVVL